VGHRANRIQTFGDVTVEDLDAGRTPEIRELTIPRPDRAEDDGPGEVALRHEAVLRAAGRLLDQRVQARAAELLAADGGQQTRAAATAQAAREVLSQVRDMGWPDGGGALPLARLAQRDLTGAIRWAEQFYPTDWLRQARERTNGRLRVKAVERGFHGHTDSMLGGSKLTIALSPNPDRGLTGGQYGETAVHEIAHHFELTVPGLFETQRAFLWRRTSRGEVGSRQRETLELLAGTTDEYGRRDEFDTPYIGREYGGDQPNFEVLTTAMQSVFGGAPHADNDPDLREWLLGVLALVGTDRPAGPARAAQPTVEAAAPPAGPAQAGPQLPADLSTLTLDELQRLMIDPAVLADDQSIARVRGEYMRRGQDLIQASRSGG
jgi:hypothetical protein